MATPQKIIFKKTKLEILIELTILFAAAVFVSAAMALAFYFLFKADVRSFESAARFFAYVLTLSLMIIPYTIYKYKTRDYWFEIENGNTINEYYGDELMNSLEFERIGSITSGGAHGNANSMIRELPVVIHGVDKNGALFDFTPRRFPPLTSMLLKLKKHFPGIQIDMAFSKDVPIYYHKKFFGEVDKERLFMLIILLLGLLGLPLFGFVYSFFAG